MKRACELCKGTARIHCESDQANLCWDCDAKVHSANFLVARHSRNLLCRLCQSPTSWSAAGSKLEPTLSDCRKCVNRSDCDGEDEEDAAAAEDEEEEMAEIHIVPWSPPQPPASESSLSGGEAAVTRKRSRLENGRLTHQDLNVCTPPSDTAVEVAVTPPRKMGRTDQGGVEVRVSKSPIVEAVRRFRREEAVSGEEMPEYSTMSDGAGAVDLNLSLGLSSR
ncbi:hypothetical protein C2S51_038046 [Perilla frutescens var. frutescens]|nr:hypothetical protein C2S51_038046 [Perilla frutescens var. frutescens]